MYFKYGKKETEYLKSRDEKLAAVIDQIGHIRREVNPDLFQSVVNSIIGQQISSAAQRMEKFFYSGMLSSDTLTDAPSEEPEREF